MKTGTATKNSSSWRKRLTLLVITGFLMGVAFVAGVAMTGIIVIRLLFPVVASGATMGLAGLASISANGAISALYSGDSEMRLTVLNGLNDAFDTEPAPQFDEPTAAWLLPALEQCRTDSDPNVVALAEELIEFINDNKAPPTP